MVEFADSKWSCAEAAAEFVENADHYIVERRRLLDLARSAYCHFVRHGGRGARVLDLGSGDGALAHELLRADGTIEATLVDASVEMLGHARRRLRAYPNVEFVRRSFQELLGDPGALPSYDMVVSALAIHHLDRGAKKALFAYVRDHLNHSGQFVNVDVVRAPEASLEQWYLELWGEWIRAHALGGELRQSFEHIPDQYKANPDNVPDSLDEQLAALRAVGFRDVDCYYKYGLFAVFGGRK